MKDCGLDYPLFALGLVLFFHCPSADSSRSLGRDKQRGGLWLGEGWWKGRWEGGTLHIIPEMVQALVWDGGGGGGGGILHIPETVQALVRKKTSAFFLLSVGI